MKITKDEINNSMDEKLKKGKNMKKIETKAISNQNTRRNIYNKSEQVKNKMKHRYGVRAVTTFTNDEE